MSDELVQETPLALALIICDEIITDQRTKKKTLVGIFNRITLRKIPHAYRLISVFVSVRGGQGVYTATLRLTHQDSEEPLVELSGPIEFRDPFHVIEIAFRLRNVPFREVGAHCFEFYCNQELILSRPFRVNIATPSA